MTGPCEVCKLDATLIAGRCAAHVERGVACLCNHDQLDHEMGAGACVIPSCSCRGFEWDPITEPAPRDLTSASETAAGDLRNALQVLQDGDEFKWTGEDHKAVVRLVRAALAKLEGTER